LKKINKNKNKNLGPKKIINIRVKNYEIEKGKATEKIGI
jgi:hypothetical protein